MTRLILGGSKSGKSEYAENCAINCKEDGSLIYLATLMVNSLAEEKIVKRHIEKRKGKGFITIERSRDILTPFSNGDYSGDTVLLEDLTNLYANEMFGKSPVKSCGEVAIEILELGKCVKNLIVVSNNIFCDGAFYEEDTLKYIEDMGRINMALSKEFDRVTELICGIEHPLKEI